MADNSTKKSYPRLAEMGVLHPQQIARYSLSSLDYVDYVRLVYERPKGSLLPVSRTYRFPRVPGTIKNGDKGVPETVMKSSPSFVEVVNELRSLIETQSAAKDIAVSMLDEIRDLEEEVSSHIENLRGLIDRIQKVT